jgi:peroxisomal membrane protein 2
MVALRRLSILLPGILRYPSSAKAFVPTYSIASISNNKLQHTTQCQQCTQLRSTGLEDLWSSYLTALDADPLLVKSATAGVILGAADLAGQSIQRATSKSDKGVDISRFLRFAFFGFVLQAPWNHFYYLLLDGALPPTEDPFSATTGIKVVIDQFIQAPIFTVIIFAFLGTLEGKSIDDIKTQLKEDYTDTMVANWKLWVPATMVNIAFCPPILRVLFLNCVFFFWSIFLSLKLNKSDSAEGS